MGVAKAVLGTGRIEPRIELRTQAGEGEFDFMLAMCKRVPGGRFARHPGDAHWHYPLSIDTCHALRRFFKEELLVGEDLAAWYRKAAVETAAQTALSAATEATLPGVPAAFAQWLRGYQRAGAAWVAKAYRNAGLIADQPGLGKTTEVLAGLLQAGITGPVLVVCPKASVRAVWGHEIRKHLPQVPVYICSGTRQKRDKELARFANDMNVYGQATKMRIVVIVAEMLRVELGDPCYTKVLDEESGLQVPNNKVSGMCPQRRRNISGECSIHLQVPQEKKKDLVPTGFSFPALFDPWLLGGGWSCVVLDESHKLLGSLSISKANLMGKGLKLLPYRTDARRYAMSGTPYGKGGRIEGMFGTLHWLWPDEYTSYWKWAAEVFEVTDKVVDRSGRTVKAIGRLRGLPIGATSEQEEEAWERFLAKFGARILRRTKAEMLEGLPPKTYIDVECEMHPAQAKQHADLIEWAEIRTSNGTVSPNGTLALLMRSRQLANGEISKRLDTGKVFFTDNSGKLDRLWEALESRGILDGAPGGKLVIASQFNEFLDTIMWRLKRDNVSHFRIDGSTSEKARDTMMTMWQSSTVAAGTRVMLLNTKAGGLSITLDAADEMHIMDEDTDPGVNEQLEDRIHRASRFHKVFIYYYRTEGTIDHKRAADTEFRRKVQHAVLDLRRGQEDIRTFMKEALEGNNDD